jgi:hypothetical protein
MLELVREYARANPPRDPQFDGLGEVDGRVVAWGARRARRLVDAGPDAPPLELPDLVAVALDPGLDSVSGRDGAAHQLARDTGLLTLRAGRWVEAVECFAAAAGRATTELAARDLMDAAAISAARGHDDTTHRFLHQAADRADAAGDGVARSVALSAAIVAWYRYPVDPAAPVPAGVSVEDMLDEARAVSGDDREAAAVLAAALAWHQGGRPRAEAAVSAAEATGDPARIAAALDVLVTACAADHQLRDARVAAVRRVSLLPDLSTATPRGVEESVDALHLAATTALVTGQVRESLDVGTLKPGLDDDGADLPRTVRALALLGRLEEAHAAAETLWRRWLADGSPPRAWMSTAGAMAVLAHGLSNDGRAGDRERDWRERTLRLAGVDVAEHSPTLAAVAAYVDARLALHRGDLGNAEHPGGMPSHPGPARLDRSRLPGCARGYQARMISPVRHPSTLRAKAAAIAGMGTGVRPGLNWPNCAELSWAIPGLTALSRTPRSRVRAAARTKPSTPPFATAKLTASGMGSSKM